MGEGMGGGDRLNTSGSDRLNTSGSDRSNSGAAALMQRVGDGRADTLGIVQHLVVPEPQHAVPSASRNRMRLASASDEGSCCPPSISTIGLAAWQTKSAMNPPIGTCRRNR